MPGTPLWRRGREHPKVAPGDVRRCARAQSAISHRRRREHPKVAPGDVRRCARALNDCTTLYYVLQYCAMQCCALLYHIILPLHYSMLYCHHCMILYSTVLRYIILFHTTCFHTKLCYAILHRTARCHTILLSYYIMLYHTILYYTIPYYSIRFCNI